MIKRNISLIVFSCIVLAACFSPREWEEKNTGTISVSSGSSKTARFLAPDEIPYLDLTITVVDSSGNSQQKTGIKGDSPPVYFTVPTGPCTITILAYLGSLWMAEGHLTHNVTPGPNGIISVQMAPPPLVDSMLVYKNPIQPSFERCYADLNGTEVGIRRIDGSMEQITINSTNRQGFYTDPMRLVTPFMWNGFQDFVVLDPLTDNEAVAMKDVIVELHDAFVETSQLTMDLAAAVTDSDINNAVTAAIGRINNEISDFISKFSLVAGTNVQRTVMLCIGEPGASQRFSTIVVPAILPLEATHASGDTMIGYYKRSATMWNASASGLIQLANNDHVPQGAARVLYQALIPSPITFK